jgi:hypothetical protein
LRKLRPTFGTYQDGEIDFLVFSFSTNCTYALDITTGQSASTTADKLLADRIADFVLRARSGSCGGIGEPGVLTIPIYLIGRFDFDSTINPPLKPSLRRERLLETALEEDDDDGYILPYAWLRLDKTFMPSARSTSAKLISELAKHSLEI